MREREVRPGWCGAQPELRNASRDWPVNETFASGSSQIHTASSISEGPLQTSASASLQNYSNNSSPFSPSNFNIVTNLSQICLASYRDAQNDCRYLLNRFQQTVNHTFWEADRATDGLVKKGCMQQEEFVILFNLLSLILQLLLMKMLLIYYVESSKKAAFSLFREISLTHFAGGRHPD